MNIFLNKVLLGIQVSSVNFYVNITQNWYAFYNESMNAVGLKGIFYVNITQNW